MNNCNARGFLKGACHSGQSDLEGRRAYWERNWDVHAAEEGRGGGPVVTLAGRCQLSAPVKTAV